LRHPLTVAVIGVAITGVLVPYFARRWQERQKAWDVRVGLIADMSEASSGLMARLKTVRRLAELADNPGASKEMRDELHRARDSLNAERHEFEIRDAVIGTKLQAYVRTPSPAIAERWTTLAEAMTELVELEGSDAAHEAEHREKVLHLLRDLGPVPMDGQEWGDVYRAILYHKAALIRTVMKEPMVFRTSWIPWGR